MFGILFSLYRGTPQHGEWVIGCLKGAWPKLLGGKLAGVCRPVRFENSKLIIEILDPDWEEAVKSVQPALLEKLRTATAGEVRRITVDSRQSAVGSR